MSSSIFKSLAQALSDLLRPIGHLLEKPRRLENLLAELGVMPETNNNVIVASLHSVAELQQQIEILSNQDNPSFESIAAVLDASANAFETLQRLGASDDLSGALEGLGRDLANLLISLYLESRFPIALPLASLLTLVDLADEQPVRLPVVEGGKLLRQPYSLHEFHLDRLPGLLRDPADALRTEYGNQLTTTNDANKLADKLFPRIIRLLRALDVTCRYGIDPEDRELLGDAAPFMEHALIIYIDDPLNGLAASGIVVTLSAADQGDLGLVISPFGALTITKPVNIWMLEMKFTGEVDVVAYGRHGLTLLASTDIAKVEGSISATLAPPDDGPAFIFGSSSGTRLEIGGADLRAETLLSDAQQSLALSADVWSSSLVIASSDTDGFVSSLLPPDGMRVDFDLGIAWSNEKGLTLRGSAGLDAIFPVGLSVAGVMLSTIHLSLQAGDVGVKTELSVTISASIGPIEAVIDRIGIASILTFPETGGNVGVADLDVRFKPPSAIGLVVDAAIVKGGGFLSIDETRGEYFGTLELKIGSINIKAIVILSTKMPDGSPGWSLLMLIYSQFPPIQLSWGFTLNGVGGLIGVQHGMQIEELKSGMRTGALDDVLFPENPVIDAPRIINRLRVIFPATPRALVVGPMLELGWSTPTIMKIRMGLLFQIDNVFGGDRPSSIKRIILLGQLLIQLPPEVEEEAVLLRLLVDFYGYYDFDINRLEFAARLRDSHVMKLPLSGMLFLRAEFGEKPTFILSAGGFHPNFKDLPADIPSPIDRLEIKFNIEIVEIRAQMYFAVTAASVQTGASIEVNASVGPVDISGWLGYDAIFYFKPRFFFEVDIRAGVLVKYRGHRLGGITLKMHLEGPGKWRARGSVTFSIFWWDIEKGFDVSWGKDPEIVQVKTKVFLLMEEALADKANWRAQLPQGGESVVTLQIAADETAVLAHPLGQLQVSQRVAPFDLELQHFGNTEVEGASEFSVTNLTVSGHQFTNEPALEFFARSHFVDMSDEEKLTSPSFEKFSSGVTVGSDDFSAPDDLIEADLEFETKYIDFTNPVPRVIDAGTVPLGISRAAFMAQMQHGAAAKSAMRSTTPLRPGGQRKIKLSEPGLQVASTDTQASAVDLQGLFRVSSALAEQEARKVLGKDALRSSHMVVEKYELSQ